MLTKIPNDLVKSVIHSTCSTANNFSLVPPRICLECVTDLESVNILTRLGKGCTTEYWVFVLLYAPWNDIHNQ
jgi:hypothetical protein